MSEGPADRIEYIADATAAVVLAVAAGYCAIRLSLSLGIAGVAATVALCCGFALLRAVRPEARHFPIHDFVPAAATETFPELATDEEQSLADAAGLPDTGSPELLLDDVLAELAPDSRVVRLFDRAAMPTPGELQAQIDRHLGSLPPAQPLHAIGVDASQALHEALAELRRSLR